MKIQNQPKQLQIQVLNNFTHHTHRFASLSISSQLNSTHHITMFAALAVSPQTTNAAEQSAALIMRPKGRERGAKRETYTNEDAKYMNDFRPIHERNNTLLSLIGNTENDGWITVSSKRLAGSRRREKKQTENQPTNESFPGLPSPQKATKPLCWVSSSSGSNEHLKSKEEFKIAAVPESAKVKNKKTSMQVLSKTSTDDAVDALNFQERENILNEDVKYWKALADSRAVILDDMENKINSLNRELDDMFDRYC